MRTLLQVPLRRCKGAGLRQSGKGGGGGGGGGIGLETLAVTLLAAALVGALMAVVLIRKRGEPRV